MTPPFSLLRPAALCLAAALAWHPCARAAEVTRVDDAILFDGRIDAGSVARFHDLLRPPGVTRLVITSGGGLVGPALDLAATVHERQLDVEVPAACLSSCANYVFPAGRRKTIGRPDAVAWHGNMAHVLYLQQSGQANWDARALAEARVLARREAELFARIGVDGFVCWFARLPPYGVEDFHALSAQDMERFGIRDVTLRQPARWTPPDPAVRRVSVDWEALASSRPAVDLADPPAGEGPGPGAQVPSSSPTGLR